MKIDKKFPIQNDAACVFKWSWATYYLSDARIHFCHRTGSLHDTTLSNMNSNPKLIEERQRMANNQWPKESCSYCKRVEDAGGFSERQLFTKDPSWTPSEFYDVEDGVLPEQVTPRILEVYFRNACNLACAYCSPMFSSKIQHEINKWGPISERYALDGNWKLKDGYEERKAELWKWFAEHGHKVKYFHILGGEPFYQSEFEECLDFLQQHKFPNLVIKVFSNLIHKPEKFAQKIALIKNLIANKHIEGFQLVCSIDAWGAEQEFARYGIDLNVWEQNWNTLVDTLEISISVQSTLCPLTLPTAYQLTRKVNEARAYRKKLVGHDSVLLQHGWNVIQDPPFLDPCIFGDYHTNYFDMVLSEITDDPDNYDIVNGYKKKIEAATVNKELVLEFYNYMEELCRRRNLDWHSLYPHLYKHTKGILEL